MYQFESDKHRACFELGICHFQESVATRKIELVSGKKEDIV